MQKRDKERLYNVQYEEVKSLDPSIIGNLNLPSIWASLKICITC